MSHSPASLPPHRTIRPDRWLAGLWARAIAFMAQRIELLRLDTSSLGPLTTVLPSGLDRPRFGGVFGAAHDCVADDPERGGVGLVAAADEGQRERDRRFGRAVDPDIDVRAESD